MIYPQLGHTNMVSSIAISPDNRYVLSGSWDNSLKLWGLKTGRVIRTFSGHTGFVNTAAFTKDGRYAVSGSNDDTLKLWDIATGKEINIINDNAGNISSIAFTPNNRYLVAGNWVGTVSFWDTKSWRKVKQFNGHAGKVKSVTITPDGKYALTGGDDRTVMMWDVKSGRKVRSFIGSPDKIMSVAVTENGRFCITGCYNGIITLFDLKTARKERSFKSDFDKLDSLTTSLDSKSILAGYENGVIEKWTIESGSKENIFNQQKGAVLSIAVTADGKNVVSGSGVGTLWLWDIETGGVKKAFTGEAEYVSAVATTPNNKYVLTGCDNNLRQWDILNGRLVQTYYGHENTISSLAITPNGHYAITGSYDNNLKLWNLENGREFKTLSGHKAFVSSVAVSPNGKYAISGSFDSTVKLWDIQKGKETSTFQGHTNVVSAVAVTPNGQYIISGSFDGTVKQWDIASREEVKSFMARGAEVLSVAVTPDGVNLLAGTQYGYMNHWNLESGKRYFPWMVGDIVSSLSVTSDSKLVLSGGNDMKLWRINSGSLVTIYPGYKGWVKSIAVDQNGKQALTGNEDGTTRLWDITTGKEIAQFISFTDGEWIAITPDGYYNASPNGDKHLNVRIGNNVYGIENYREAFFRPDLVKIALSGGSLKSYRNIADVKQPPQVEIIDTPLTVAGDELTVKLKLTDIGGGIGDVRLYLNSSAIMLDNSRGLKVVDKGISRSYKIRLARGDNIIRAVAFNADNTMQSNPAEQTVTATYTPTAKPTLHALVIGINEFKNPKLRLQYAEPDADLFTETLKKGASDLFGKVNIVRLTTPDQTTSENIANELKKMRTINPDDLFILFVASHGTVDDGEYFLLTSNVGSTSTVKLKSDALSQNKIKELIANIPTTKKVIVLDTCNAGQMGDALQVAMLTRGMSEDTAFKILSRAVGSTILSSATSTQEALEGYQGHGLFTWVLAEGMKGKADKGKTGLIKTTDLVDYVESEVPEIAEKYFRRKQYPTTAVSGQGFPIGKSGL